MKKLLSFSFGLMGAGLLFSIGLQAAPELTEVAAFPHQQVTGIGVSKKSGRIFVNFPYWADPFQFSVAELKPGTSVDRGATAAGKLRPFPDAAWNAKQGDPAKRFVCVQSVVVDDEDHLWVVDAASPKQDGVVPGGAKLVEIDLATNRVMRVILIPDQVAPKKSYLNDIRIDTAAKAAYLTESGVGSLIVVDLASGKSRAVLRNHYSTKADASDMVIDGIRPIDVKTGRVPMFQADGIALDAARGILYYHPLTSYALYRIATADLRNAASSEKELGDRVVKVEDTRMPDGMLEGPDGGVYLTDFENDSVDRLDPATGVVTTVVKDPRLQWPDTMAWGRNGTLYVTASQIHRMPSNNAGVSRQAGPFKVFSLQIDPAK